ncbi:MAG: hypothetical protein HOV81_02075, partial [Kofleriaceae bacterium]|nr:hypothetical protein [Kofleriaceae bacterium]
MISYIDTILVERIGSFASSMRRAALLLVCLLSNVAFAQNAPANDKPKGRIIDPFARMPHPRDGLKLPDPRRAAEKAAEHDAKTPPAPAPPAPPAPPPPPPAPSSTGRPSTAALRSAPSPAVGTAASAPGSAPSQNTEPSTTAAAA